VFESTYNASEVSCKSVFNHFFNENEMVEKGPQKISFGQILLSVESRRNIFSTKQNPYNHPKKYCIRSGLNESIFFFYVMNREQKRKKPAVVTFLLFSLNMFCFSQMRCVSSG